MTLKKPTIWIVATGEPVPFVAEESRDRYLRAGKLSEYFAAQGYDTVWWTARFNHNSKSHRNVNADVLVKSNPGQPDLVFLGSSGYRSHIGLARLRDHWQLGRNFRRLAPSLDRPDVIFCSYPTVELAYEAVRFGKKYGIPVIIDVRDLWPDVIYERLEQIVKIRVNGMLVPYERMARYVFKHATAVTAISTGILNWAQTRFQRPESKISRDASFYQFKQEAPAPGGGAEEKEYFKCQGIDLDADITRFVWVGNIVPDTDADALLEAIEKLPDEVARKLEFVICGNGSLVERVKKMSKNHPHLKYAGWVNAKQITALMTRSHIGLLCYLDRLDFRISIPNKVLDYLDGECRILTNLEGEIDVVCKGTDAVIRYPTGNVDALTELFSQIAASPDHFRQKFETGKAIFREHFWSDRVLPQIEEFILSNIKQDKERKNQG
ncbi:glycosyltransferase [Marivivens sp. LCG002]|uniref:glycosyltransferase n=1 Tax=Marivivens sp. LCG002 TaxID=3051171 RepID=UPI0025561C34|nr:glycosyltransferase [Marivivens sp. LCG002]WIV51404.1 glycosyltransferase [Marivivens sp. LCG002]